jgi:hypothetical protein
MRKSAPTYGKCEKQRKQGHWTKKKASAVTLTVYAGAETEAEAHIRTYA